GAIGPATVIDCGKRSTTDTAMRNPAANDSNASSTRTLRDARQATAAAPRMFALAAATPYNNADGVTQAGVRVVRRRPLRHSQDRERRETAGDSSSNFWYARATAPRGLSPRASRAIDPFARR